MASELLKSIDTAVAALRQMDRDDPDLMANSTDVLTKVDRILNDLWERCEDALDEETYLDDIT